MNDRNQTLPANMRLIAPPDERPKRPLKRRVPGPPSWLPDEAKKVWQRTAKLMVERGIWQPHHQDCLATYSVLFAEFQCNPKSFSAAMVAQMRVYQNELSITPASERNAKRLERK